MGGGGRDTYRETDRQTETEMRDDKMRERGETDRQRDLYRDRPTD